MANQLNTLRSPTLVVRLRPTWRCSGNKAAPAAPPVHSAARAQDRINRKHHGQASAGAGHHHTEATGAQTMPIGITPSGQRQKTWVRANSANNTPTAAGLCALVQASRGVAMRSPVMQAWIEICAADQPSTRAPRHHSLSGVFGCRVRQPSGAVVPAASPASASAGQLLHGAQPALDGAGAHIHLLKFFGGRINGFARWLPPLHQTWRTRFSPAPARPSTSERALFNRQVS